MRPQYKVGDKVDFVNDYGVVFRNKTIKEIDTSHESTVRYFIEPTDSPWFSVREENLHPAGTYEPNFDLKLKNGSIAKFLRYSDSVSPLKLFVVKDKDKEFQAVLLGEIMYSLNSFEEPVFPLSDEYQPIEGESDGKK